MNTKSAFVILLLLLLPTATSPSAKTVNTGKVWTVDDDGPADFQSIQEAVDAADSGDTVFVHNGVYVEHVSINKTISLVGENSFNTIIDADYSSPAAILIHAQDVTVRNLTAKNSQHAGHWGREDIRGGIYLDQSSGCIVEDCIVTGNEHGINLRGSKDNIVSHNLAERNNCGIRISYASTNSENNLVEGNWLVNNTRGMRVGEYAYNNTITNNLFFNNYCSLIVWSPATGAVYHNNFVDDDALAIDASMGDFNISWSMDERGNFYKNSTGADVDGDGIGDTPYVIQYITWNPPYFIYENTSDDCPLMNPINWLQGDINLDMKVNIVDIALIAKAYGIHFGDAGWNPRCDLNSDNVIDILDIAVAAVDFDKQMTWQPT